MVQLQLLKYTQLALHLLYLETSAAGSSNLIISGTTGIRLTGDGGNLFDGGGGNNTSMFDANGVSSI